MGGACPVSTYGFGFLAVSTGLKYKHRKGVVMDSKLSKSQASNKGKQAHLLWFGPSITDFF